MCDLERSSPGLPLLVLRVSLGAGAALRLNDPPIFLLALAGFAFHLWLGQRMLHVKHEQKLQLEDWYCAGEVVTDVA